MHPVPRGPVEHDEVEERSLIERYHLGSLSAAEEEGFETHLMDCARCQEELEVQGSFLRGMKTVAAQAAARYAVGVGVLAWLSRRRVALALAVVAALGVGLAFGHLWLQNQRLETRVARLSTVAGSVPGELGAPLTGVPVTLLGVLRGDGEPPSVATGSGGPYALAVDVGADPRVASYAVTVLDSAGAVRFERRDLLPDDLEVIQLTFPAGFLPPGEHRLIVRGSLPDGESVEIGGYPFRVANGR